MKKIVNFLSVVVGSLLLSTASASAADWKPFGGAQCNGAGQNSAVCEDAKQQSSTPNKDPISGKDGLIMKVANIVSVVAGMAAVIIIVLAGLRFASSGGSTEDTNGARRALIYASVGLVVIILARAIIGLVLNSL